MAEHILRAILKTNDPPNDQTEGNGTYIDAIDSNNEIANYMGQDAIQDGNTITLNYNGSVGEAFYQPKPF